MDFKIRARSLRSWSFPPDWFGQPAKASEAFQPENEPLCIGSLTLSILNRCFYLLVLSLCFLYSITIIAFFLSNLCPDPWFSVVLQSGLRNIVLLGSERICSAEDHSIKFCIANSQAGRRKRYGPKDTLNDPDVTELSACPTARPLYYNST